MLATEAGGGTDFVARLIAQGLTESLRHQVIVDNRGNQAAQIAARAPPDGYTLALLGPPMWVSPLLQQVQYDPIKDFAPVTLAASSANVLVVHPSLPVSSVKELIAYAKAKPGGLNYGSTGIGNPLHLTMEMLKTAAGIDIQAVPYRGDAPLNAALIAGEIQVGVVPMATTLPHLQNDLLKALAVGGMQRAAALPNVPTVAETVPGFESSSWQGLFVPANTPREIVMTIQRETAKALKAPDLIERLKTGGNEPVGSTPDEFDARFRADIAKFAKIVKDARIPTQD